VTEAEEAEHGMVYGFDLLAHTAEGRDIAKGTLGFVWTGAAR
jgi:hypothetical protein